MIVTRRVTFRLYPKPAQERKLYEWRRLHCYLYNSALADRKDSYQKLNQSVNYLDQQNRLPEFKKVWTEFVELTMNSQSKRCNTCKQILSLTSFYAAPKSNDGYHWSCKTCMSAKEKALRQSRLKKGLCCECDTERLSSHERYCEFHYVKFTANANLKKSDRATVMTLLKKLATQGYRCPYTGEKLILGVNTQLDHIYPVSRFPDRRGDLSNVEWISTVANLAKRDLTKTEFIALCGLIHHRHLEGLV